MEENKTVLDGQPETAEASEAPTEKKTTRTCKSKTEQAELKKALAEQTAAAETARAELAELQDKYLRMMAEYDNFRRRTAKEREASYGEAVADAIASFLPVLDNLERAALYTDAEKVAEGLALTAKAAQETLTRLGIEETATPGCTFDPQQHNAVLHVEDEEHGESEVLEVLQRGYRKGERILRYAMVKVAN